jgi:hypothetical protein
VYEDDKDAGKTDAATVIADAALVPAATLVAVVAAVAVASRLEALRVAASFVRGECACGASAGATAKRAKRQSEKEVLSRL